MMKKWLIGGGVVGALAVVLLTGSLVTGALAQNPTPPQEATTTPEQAQAAALEANPGATVVKTELESENGALVYEVELSNGLEMMVDAGNGAILGTEQEDAGEAIDDADDVQEEVESDAEDADDEAGDLDDVQEEFEDQADDALEAPDVEDVPGQ
jgi:hypothetical protein